MTDLMPGVHSHPDYHSFQVRTLGRCIDCERASEPVTQPCLGGAGLGDDNRWTALREWLLSQAAVTEKSANAVTGWGGNGPRTRGGLQKARAAAFRTVLLQMDRMAGES